MNGNRIAKLVIGGLFILFGSRLIAGTNNTKNENNIAYDEVEAIMKDASSDDDIEEGSVVALSGKVMLDDDELVTDELTGVSAHTAYLKRKVEVYQWVRDCGEDGDDCRYQKEWSEEKYDSDSYDDSHKNPEWEHEDKDLFAKSAKLGKYLLGDDILRGLPTEQLTESKTESEWSLKNDYYYSHSNSAEIGDLRISYEKNKDDTVSILAMVNNDAVLVPFKASNGESVFVAHAGEHNAKELLQMAHNKNTLSNVVMIILSCALIGAGALFVANAFKKNS